MTEFLFFLNIGIVLIAFFVTSKKNNLQDLIFSIKHSSKMLQLEIDDTRRYIQNKQNLLSNISNNYENYYESALQQLEKCDSSKNIEKEIIKEKIYKLIDEYNDNRIAAKKKLISRVSSNNSSSSYNNSSSSSSSYDNSYSSYTDFSTSNSYSSSSSDSSSSYSGDGGSFGGGGSGGDW
jgi:uncharacterized membrane protein YgcG